MIEKFNFYDVYGYFLPGLAFLAVLWLPVGIVQKSLPKGEWGSAIALLALAYVGGQFLQSFATNALPSKIADGRYPSDAALDPVFNEKNAKLPDQLRAKIETIVRDEFGLELRVNEVGKGEIDKARNNAFSLARNVLAREKGVSYAEQFQGMYALARGLVVAFGFGFAYMLGWFAGSFTRTAWCVHAAYFVMSFAILLVVIVSYLVVRKNLKENTQRYMEITALISLSIALLSVGYLAERFFSLGMDGTNGTRTLLLMIALGMLLASLRFYRAYKFFASHFAITVWRDFLAFNALRQDK